MQSQQAARHPINCRDCISGFKFETADGGGGTFGAYDNTRVVRLPTPAFSSSCYNNATDKIELCGLAQPTCGRVSATGASVIRTFESGTWGVRKGELGGRSRALLGCRCMGSYSSMPGMVLIAACALPSHAATHALRPAALPGCAGEGCMPLPDDYLVWCPPTKM